MLTPIQFTEANTVLQPPKGMETTCRPLPIYTDGMVCTSVWLIDKRSMAELLRSKMLFVQVFSGMRQPPVNLQVVPHATVRQEPRNMTPAEVRAMHNAGPNDLVEFDMTPSTDMEGHQWVTLRFRFPGYGVGLKLKVGDNVASIIEALAGASQDLARCAQSAMQDGEAQA